jgi:hypothetical protein
VFVDNKPKANVSVKALEVEKEVSTNLFGKYLIQFYEADSNNVYRLEFFESVSKIDTIVEIKNNMIKTYFNLYFFSKPEIKITSKKLPNHAKFLQLNPTDIAVLDSLLKKEGFLLTYSSPQYKIEIKYSGEIEHVEHNMYRYNGGFVSIYINGNECSTIKEMRLEKTFYAGNSLDFVNSEIKKQIKENVSKEPLIVLKKIKECFH